MNKLHDPSTAFIAVGSNIEPETYIPEALRLLKQHVTVTASSTFYRTKPIGRPDQPDFINGLWQIHTTHSPQYVKHHILHSIENQLGRTHTTDKYASRTIDLDLILYNDLQMKTPDLMLPHPDLQRPFVYIPLHELLTRQDQPSLFINLLPFLPGSINTKAPGETLEELTTLLQDIVCQE